jgi:predicted Ser/Thr protein kinase
VANDAANEGVEEGNEVLDIPQESLQALLNPTEEAQLAQLSYHAMTGI